MFTLRVPITVPAGDEISARPPMPFADGITLEFIVPAPAGGPSLHPNPGVLIFSGFLTESDATTFLADLEAGLLWVLLKADLVVDGRLDLRPPMFTDGTGKMQIGTGAALPWTPKGAGVFDATTATIHLSSMTLRGMSMSGVLVKTYDATRIITPLIEWYALTTRAAVLKPELRQLRLAFDLYAAHLTETTATVKFINLIMALEALCTAQEKPQQVQALMDQWEQELAARLTTEPDGDARSAMHALKNELSFRRGSSIKAQLRYLVQRALSAAPADEVKAETKLILRLYDVRSALMHTGEPKEPIGPALNDASRVVRKVLVSLAMQIWEAPA